LIITVAIASYLQYNYCPLLAFQRETKRQIKLLSLQAQAAQTQQTDAPAEVIEMAPQA
jgi:hypothetical protein